MLKKLLIIVVLFVAGVVLFAGGVFLGVYYHKEIVVFYYHYVNGEDTNVVASVTPTPVDLSSDPAVVLPSLDKPLPLVFADTLEETVIQERLKEGAVVLPLGTEIGETGNVVITAHSSGTKDFGPYRFAFAKLSELEPGQEFTVNTPGAGYRYRVYKKEVVWPHEVDRLPDDERSTVTLVTCWPLWTNFKRLLVHAELVEMRVRNIENRNIEI